MPEEQLEDVRVGRRCFISNLQWRTSWQDLKDAFRDCGNVVYANVIRDEGGGLGRGHGPLPHGLGDCA